MNKYHQEILNEIKKKSGNVQATDFVKRYVGTNHVMYKIKTDDFRRLVKDWTKSHKDISVENFSQTLDSLYSGRSFQEICFGPELLKLFPKFRQQLAPKSLDKWLNYCIGWAEIDTLCQNTFPAKELLDNWSLWESVLIKFSQDKSVSKRRASLVLLTFPVRKSNDPRLAKLAFENLEKLKSEKDILITKAVSWLLRSLITHNRNLVEDYLNKNSEILPKIALRETRNKLKTGRK